MKQQFNLTIDYQQIAVFESTLKNPFNDWTPAHINQGFSWRPLSVSFSTLEEGNIEVEVKIANKVVLCKKTIRAIQVPFITKSGKLAIASIADSKKISVPINTYLLIFETGYNQKKNWCRFTFIPSLKPQPAILLQDEELTISNSLLMEAKEA